MARRNYGAYRAPTSWVLLHPRFWLPTFLTGLYVAVRLIAGRPAPHATIWAGATLGAVVTLVWQHHAWDYHGIPACSFLLLLWVAAAVVWLEDPRADDLPRGVSLAMAGVTGFVLAVTSAMQIGNYAAGTRQEADALTRILDDGAPGGVLPISTSVVYTQPAILAADERLTGHYTVLWMIMGLFPEDVNPDYERRTVDVDRVVEHLALDLAEEPEWLLVEETIQRRGGEDPSPFSFVEWMERTPELAAELERYERIPSTQLSNHVVYRLRD